MILCGLKISSTTYANVSRLLLPFEFAQEKPRKVITIYYNEQVVQRSGHTKEEGLKDYCLKEKGLVGFFMPEPGLFDIEFVGLHETKLPRENYRVRQSIVELD